eukprot:98809_1
MKQLTEMAAVVVGCVVLYYLLKNVWNDALMAKEKQKITDNIQLYVKQINDSYEINDTIDYAEIIDDFLYLSDYQFAQDIDQLNAIGIDRILNCGGKGLEMEFARIRWPQHFKRKVIHAVDADDYPIIDKHGKHAFKFILKCKKENKKCLVHCRSGVNRSAAIVVGYLIKHKHMKLLDAVRKVREKRQVPILSNATFNEQLVKLAKHTNNL